MKKALISFALIASLQASVFAQSCNPPVHTRIDVGVDREVIHRDEQCQTVASVPTTSENMLIALSGMLLAFGLVAARKRLGAPS